MNKLFMIYQHDQWDSFAKHRRQTQIKELKIACAGI